MDVKYTPIKNPKSNEPDEGNEDNESQEKEKVKYPWQVAYIISTEACERFSFYGMRTILTLYVTFLFQQYMTKKKSEDTATIIYHTFNFFCYFTPLFGASLADSSFGKFRTIFYISILYFIGQCVLSFGAFGAGSQPISFIGLFLIAIGTGGIKPCVVSFGGDQFKLPEQKIEMGSFFAMFYASINMGSLVSTFLTPYLREVECMGQNSCYSLAFGVPAALMLSAIICFFCGKNKYTVTKPETNVIVESFKCIKHAIARRKFNKKEDHWLDASSDRFTPVFISNLKAVLRVGFLFLPYPMFWALYDQQGSRWTLQATKMNGVTFGFTILPDQMQVVNPILILILIPLFDRVVYPLLAKCGLLTTPLQRIVTGGFLVCAAFLMSAAVEINIDRSPEKSVHLFWLLPQYITISTAEILFSITSLEFAYSQAPSSMKAFTQALYCLTTAFGNLIDIAVVAIMASLQWTQVTEFLLFAGLMAICMFILALMARQYTYVDCGEEEEQLHLDQRGQGKDYGTESPDRKTKNLKEI